jgi:hypothetical protein
MRKWGIEHPTTNIEHPLKRGKAESGAMGRRTLNAESGVGGSRLVGQMNGLPKIENGF